MTEPDLFALAIAKERNPMVLAALQLFADSESVGARNTAAFLHGYIMGLRSAAGRDIHGNDDTQATPENSVG